MISEPLERQGMHGYMLRYLGVDTFKLAIVVGYEPSDKTFRVRLFRAATKQWTKSKKRVGLDKLAPLTADEKRERRTLIENAFDGARHNVHTRPYV